MAGKRRRSWWVAYHEGSRRPSVAFAFLLPLLTVYEVGRFVLGGNTRNAAEAVLKDGSGLLSGALPFLEHLLFLVVLVVAFQVFRRRVPLLRWFPLLVLETFLLAVLLGPVVGEWVQWMGLEPESGGGRGLAEDLLLSIGAGVYEELLFRFLLLAGSFSLLHRVLDLPARSSTVIAVLLSAAFFAVYHHLGPSGEPWSAPALAFRFGAGIVFGSLFTVRGLAVCAYLHAQYDILFDLRSAGILP